MKPFLPKADQEQIERAIAAAELRTSGEIRVMIYPGITQDALATAEEEFSRLGMHRTRRRNAVLILVAPQSHAFAIFGDAGIHSTAGQAFWQEVAAVTESHFRRGAFTDGLVLAVERTGNLLAKDFPRSADDVDELSNAVIDRGIVI